MHLPTPSETEVLAQRIRAALGPFNNPDVPLDLLVRALVKKANGRFDALDLVQAAVQGYKLGRADALHDTATPTASATTH